MSNLILSIVDVFQIPGRGTVITGLIGAAWHETKMGDSIDLKTPDGRNIKTAIRDMELFRRGVLNARPGEPPKHGGILLADAITSEQAPLGTQILKITVILPPDVETGCKL